MKQIEYSLGEIIELIWDDISVDPNWQLQSEIDEVPEDAECKTIGYFLHTTKKFTILAGISGTHSADVNSVIRIPTGCIKEHRKLP